jgi:hypothetical protein
VRGYYDSIYLHEGQLTPALEAYDE